MGYVWLIIGIIVVGMFAEAPWLMTGIVLTVIGLFLFFALRDVKADKSTGGNTVKVVPTTDVDSDFVREVVRFFEGYLTLCDKYQVQGHAFLSTQEANEFGCKCDIGAHIFTFEGEKAADTLGWIKRRYNEMLTALRNDGYDAWKLKRDGFEEYMEETYLGLGKDLHYCFSDADEWKFNEGSNDVTLGFERQFFLTHGKWNPTLVSVKNELKKKFPDADIQVHNYGIMVR